MDRDGNFVHKDPKLFPTPLGPDPNPWSGVPTSAH